MKQKLFRLSYSPPLGFGNSTYSELYRAKDLDEAIIRAVKRAREIGGLLVQAVEEIQE